LRSATAVALLVEATLLHLTVVLLLRAVLLLQVEASNQVLGKTVLYLPSQLSEITDVAAAAKDKDLVQHLESIVIHWTRQIKDVVSIAALYYCKTTYA
jgi:hypothetical protein